MKRSTRFLAVFVVILSVASALADPYLGTITVSDGGTANNINTTCLDAGRRSDGGIASDGGVTDFLYAGCGFDIAPGTILTVQCRGDTHVNTDVSTCAMYTCPKIYAEQWLTMPVSRSQRGYSFTRYDGTLAANGTTLNSATVNYSNGLVSIIPADGGTTASCSIYAQTEVK